MSAEGDSAVGAPERLHPLFLLTGLGGSLRGMAGGYAFVAYLAVSGRTGTALIAAIALFAFVFAGVALYWRRFEFRVGAGEIRVDSGIISRTHRSIPFDRIQDVDITQGPAARLLGLAKVKFETGGAAAANSEEGVLHAIPLRRAEELRLLVRARRRDAAPPAAASDAPDSPPVFAMPIKRVLLAGLFNFSLAVFAGLFGLTQTVGDVIGFDPLNRDFWEPWLSEQSRIAAFLLANRVAAALAGLLVLVLVGIATGIIRTLFRDYGFRLDRTDVGLRRRRGLTTVSDVSLPAVRAQAAIVATGPVRDAFGWRELKLQSLARDEGGKGDHVLAPLARDAEVGKIIVQLGWRPVGDAVEWRRVSSAYIWTLALGVAPLLLVTLVSTALVTPFALVGFAILLAMVAVRWLAWGRTYYALDGDRLLVRSGWWQRRTLILPLRRIQSIDLTSNFVSRQFGVASLAFGVAGGSGFSSHAIPALQEKSARELHSRLLSPNP